MRILLLGLMLPIGLILLVLGGLYGLFGWQRVDCGRDWDYDAEATRCEAMYRSVLTHWSEHGEFPSSLRELDLPAPQRNDPSWRYEATVNHVSLSLGDYEACDWEISREFGWWYMPRIAPPPELGRESLLLLRLIMAHQLEVGEWPASLEDLGLAPDWGGHGPWQIDPPVASDPLDTTQSGAVRRLQAESPFAVRFYWMPEWYYNT